MGDEEPQCKVEYSDLPDGGVEETNWIKRTGKCKVTYPNGEIFEGTYDSEKVKQGYGVYIWMGPTSDEDETPTEKGRFEGNYKDGLKQGFGRMKFPNGDIYEGEWFENKMQGEGTYQYKKSQDIYSGSWQNDLKHGQGRYEFGADSSMLVGTWEYGQITTGQWVLQGAAVFDGQFKLGRPFGAGTFTFASGLKQTGIYAEKKLAEGDEEEPLGEGEAPRPPNVIWQGDSIVSF